MYNKTFLASAKRTLLSFSTLTGVFGGEGGRGFLWPSLFIGLVIELIEVYVKRRKND